MEVLIRYAASLAMSQIGNHADTRQINQGLNSSKWASTLLNFLRMTKR